jgi:16S rRNA C967 or C1407 C5-methylase (RsmB/RsmF family)
MGKDRFQQFYRRMEQLLGSAEASQFMEALKQVSPKTVRFNRRQIHAGELPGKIVPWCSPYGRYWENKTRPSGTIEYAAGKYYIQEASAMLAIFAAAQAIDFSAKIVLDLAAAPGGKATQAAELIDTGYLVANEVIRKRVDALTWNINRHRLNNVIVTSLRTGFLAHALPGFFDVVIVDAPCSGEGLFRIGKHSPADWSEKNVRFCAHRQESILKDAAQLVRPDGYIVYSTCTFSREENEDQVEFLFGQGFAPVPLPDHVRLPVSPAITENEKVRACSRRIFPHREGGAGAFVGVVQKESTPLFINTPQPQWKYEHYKSKKIASFPYIRSQDLEGYVYESKGVLSYFSYDRIPGILWENNRQIGAPLMDRRRGNTPMFGSVQLAAPEALIEIGEQEAEAYIRGEDLPIDYPDGYYYMVFQGMVLGPVKVAKNRAVNQLPRSLRKKLQITNSRLQTNSKLQ